jgi:hypothetical protein
MTSQAQVYSQNIVGYINVQLTNTSGFTLIANQLDLDGTGLHNGIYTAVGTNLPSGSQVECWNGTSFKTATFNGTAWSAAANTALFTNSMNPSGGFFMYVPTPTNVTFVGNVITGTNTYPVIAGFRIVSNGGPVTGGIQTVLGYTPSVNDQVEVWNGTTYKTHTYNGSAWNGGGEPVLTVGEAVFLNAANNTNWTQILNVQ